MCRIRNPCSWHSIRLRGGIGESVCAAVSSLPHFLLSSPSALQCQGLQAPDKARMNCAHRFGAFRYQSTCSFTCDEGLLLVGASELQCLATGDWSAGLPECQGKMDSSQLLGNELQAVFKRLCFRGGNCVAPRKLRWTEKWMNAFIPNPVIGTADAPRRWAGSRRAEMLGNRRREWPLPTTPQGLQQHLRLPS